MKLSEINIYPIKSLKGIALKRSMVEDRGLRNDRRWMLTDEKGKFLTQRQFAVMAKVKVELGENGLTAVSGRSRLELPMEPDTDERVSVSVWQSRVRAAPYSAEVNRWFSEALGMECRLVRMPAGSRRIVSPHYAVRRFKDIVSFADGYPFMMIGQSSLDDLNSRLDEPVPMNRFRPSLVVSGGAPFEEDSWKKIRIGSTVFHLVKPCGRCVVTTIDQKKGVKAGPEPLATLSTYRKKNGSVLFGQNMIADAAGGELKLGDDVEVLERR